QGDRASSGAWICHPWQMVPQALQEWYGAPALLSSQRLAGEPNVDGRPARSVDRKRAPELAAERLHERQAERGNGRQNDISREPDAIVLHGERMCAVAVLDERDPERPAPSVRIGVTECVRDELVDDQSTRDCRVDAEPDVGNVHRQQHGFGIHRIGAVEAACQCLDVVDEVDGRKVGGLVQWCTSPMERTLLWLSLRAARTFGSVTVCAWRLNRLEMTCRLFLTR
ncbi:MAG: hypothetical protein H6Q29_1568, partial [Bacteroidetes bacterium]|nr:hypothetical protein [Bacteroidota bacterium]